MADKRNDNTITLNRKALHDYFILEKYEAGIELFGTEIKSIRCGGVNLKDAWCDIKDGEIFIKNMHISPYEKGNIFNKDPMSNKKLLMHKKEIRKLFESIKQDGLTVIPLSLYYKGSRVKASIALCKGKHVYDKRQSIAQKEAERDIERAFKNKNREY